jgi:hypothetical protein
LEVCPKSRFEGISIDAGRASDAHEDEGRAGHEMHQDVTDAQSQEREIRKKGNKEDTESKKGRIEEEQSEKKRKRAKKEGWSGSGVRETLVVTGLPQKESEWFLKELAR